MIPKLLRPRKYRKIKIMPSFTNLGNNGPLHSSSVKWENKIQHTHTTTTIQSPLTTQHYNRGLQH